MTGCGSKEPQTSRLELPANPSTGYEWQVVQDKELFDLDSEYMEDKKDVFFDLNSLRVAYGEGNSFKISLLDEDGALLRDLLVDVEMFFNDVSVKNYTINISNFNIPLNYGSGVYAFNCSFEGNRYYWNSSAEFIIDVDRISTELYGVGAVEVLDENTFLS